MIELFNVSHDAVIRSSVSQGATTYGYALERIFPLINKFEEQRKVQRRRFYERLRQDIVRGCLMPPITLAFVNEGFAPVTELQRIQEFVEESIGSGYVLDGMQRLTTLSDARSEREFDLSRPLYVNVIIAERYDLLLYRMITLNNGQKPMTARHQIEMLTKGLLDTEKLDITIVSEKETETAKFPGAFKRADIAAAYTAFLTNSVNNENSRIIETKLDEILVGKVMESNLTDSAVSFQQLLFLVNDFSFSPTAKDWLRLGNNLIGFVVGARSSYDRLKLLSPDEFERLAQTFEEAFSAFSVSKINVGKFRRELSASFFAMFDKFDADDVEAVTQAFFEQTMVD